MHSSGHVRVILIGCAGHPCGVPRQDRRYLGNYRQTYEQTYPVATRGGRCGLPKATRNAFAIERGYLVVRQRSARRPTPMKHAMRIMRLA